MGSVRPSYPDTLTRRCARRGKIAPTRSNPHGTSLAASSWWRHWQWRRAPSARERSRSDWSRFPSGCIPPPSRAASRSTCSTQSAAAVSAPNGSAPSASGSWDATSSAGLRGRQGSRRADDREGAGRPRRPRVEGDRDRRVRAARHSGPCVPGRGVLPRARQGWSAAVPTARVGARRAGARRHRPLRAPRQGEPGADPRHRQERSDAPHHVLRGRDPRRGRDPPRGDGGGEAGGVQLARRLVDELARPRFDPAKYRDEYRARVLQACDARRQARWPPSPPRRRRAAR